MTPSDFQDPYSGFQFGLPPSQIDVLLAISGLSFNQAWEQSVPGLTGDRIPLRYISLDHLIENKLAAGRLRDSADAEALVNAKNAIAASEKEESK